MIKDRVSLIRSATVPRQIRHPERPTCVASLTTKAPRTATYHALLSGHFSGSDTELLVARDTFTYPPAPGCSEVRRAAARRPTALRYVVPLPP